LTRTANTQHNDDLTLDQKNYSIKMPATRAKQGLTQLRIDYRGFFGGAKSLWCDTQMLQANLKRFIPLHGSDWRKFTQPIVNGLRVSVGTGQNAKRVHG